MSHSPPTCRKGPMLTSFPSCFLNEARGSSSTRNVSSSKIGGAVKRSRFTGEQFIGTLKQVEAGATACGARARRVLRRGRSDRKQRLRRREAGVGAVERSRARGRILS